MKYAALLLSLLCLAGCGGQAATKVSNPVPAPPPSVPPPPVSLPRSYSLTILPPVDGGTAAQAEAINASGTVAGYSVVNGRAEATLWRDGTTIDLGEGWAVAINDAGIAAGHVNEGFLQAMTWPGGSLGALPGYDSSIATGIDNDGTVVGVAFVLAHPDQQTGLVDVLDAGTWNNVDIIVAPATTEQLGFVTLSMSGRKRMTTRNIQRLR